MLKIWDNLRKWSFLRKFDAKKLIRVRIGSVRTSTQKKLTTMNYGNLTNTTVFDFTSNEIILKKLFSEYTGNKKNGIISMLQSDSIANGFYLWSFAEITGDNAMVRAIEQQFDMNEIYGFDPD